MAQRAASSASGRLNRRFLLVAILLAGLSAALVYAKIAATDSPSSGGTAAGGDQPVVVARLAIKQRTTISADMLEVKNINAGALTTGLTFSTIESVVGQVTKYPIEVNQQVLISAVVDTSKPLADAQLSAVVPSGKRAFSISASQVLTAGGLLLPGDYVDVVWVCCEKGIEWQGTGSGKTFSTSAIVLSRPVVQNVQVLAVAQSIIPSGPAGTKPETTTGGGVAAGGQTTDGDPIAADTPSQVPDAATITLLLTPEQASILLMAEATGTLRASLRNSADEVLIPSLVETTFISPGLIPADILRVLQDTFTKKD